MATTKQVVIFRRDLKVHKGKIGSQVAHASLGAVKSLMTLRDNPKSMSIDYYELAVERISAMGEWWNDAETTIVLGTSKDSSDHQQELLDLQAKATALGLPNCVIIDNGTTEFGGVKTMTCLAIGPGYVEEFTGLTDHLTPL
jgi:PTH2 family peptidyl-tRNA hydrolase